MEVIHARNAHQALPKGVWLLQQRGRVRNSRNGSVLAMPEPVTTCYARPLERVVFWADREANPFFHLYESLWMLAGRDDIYPLTRYVKRMESFSDNGLTQRGAYGKRWRDWFPDFGSSATSTAMPSSSARRDQLRIIARRLSEDWNDRRCVLQMWDAPHDLDVATKDAPCNIAATLQRGVLGALDLVVFCRSNDIVWGAYGANAVHFSFMQEYVARLIGCDVGTYEQVSVNYHAYAETFAQVVSLRNVFDGLHSIPEPIPDPYVDDRVRVARMPKADVLDQEIRGLLWLADNGVSFDMWHESGHCPSEWFRDIARVLHAHYLWRVETGRLRYERPLEELSLADEKTDWVVAAREWITRRRDRWLAKQEQEVAS